MRKPRDYDAELKTLDAKARRLKELRIRQLGELVIACEADTLSTEQLAGALLATQEASPQAKEGWRQRGQRFFQHPPRKPGGRGADAEQGGTLPHDHATPSA